MDPSLLATDYSSYASSSSSSTMTTGNSNTPSTSGGPQSPNALAMSLLNNLMQIQGLENNIVQQQLSNSLHPGAGAGSSSAQVPPPYTNNSTLLLEQQIKLSQLQQLQQLQNQIFQQQIALISGQSPSMLPSSPHVDSSRQSGGSNDQYTGLPTPGASAEIRPQRPSMSMDFTTLSPSASSVANYMEPLPRAHIPLPAASSSSTSSSSNSISNTNDHTQQQQHAQGHSPNPNMIQNQHYSQQHGSSSHARHNSGSEGSMNLNLQRQLQALSNSQHHQQQRPYHPLRQGRTPSSTAFHYQQQGMSSPIYHPISPIHNATSPHDDQARNPNFEHIQNHSQRSSSHHMVAPHSAPERVAFQIFQGPFPGGEGSSGGIPGLALGPAGMPLNDGHSLHHGRRMSLSESPRYAQGQRPVMASQMTHINQMQILDQDISPLTSPWLGAHPTSSANPNSHGAASTSPSNGSAVSASVTSSGSNLKPGGAGSKRTASSSGDEGGGGSGRSRKKQSPAIRPTLGLRRGERERGSASPFGGKSAGGKEAEKESSKGRAEKDRELTLHSSSSSARSGSGSVSPAPDLSGPEYRARSSENANANASSSMSATPTTSGANNTNSTSNSDSNIVSNSNALRSYRGSRSTNSTPLLRSTPTSLVMTATSAASMSGNSAKNKSRSKSGGRRGSGGVDRSMPPPRLPASVGRGGSSGSNGGGGGMEVDANVGGMDMNMNNMGGMEGMGMGMGMGGMNMDMDMGMGGMSMDVNGMGINSFGSMDMMDMGSGMDFANAHQQQGPHSQQQQPLVPVTPASIMNLGRLGINNTPGGSGRLGSASASASASLNSNNASGGVGAGSGTTASAVGRQAKTTKKDVATSSGKSASGTGAASTSSLGGGTTTTRSGRVSTRRMGIGGMVSPSLKPLLPAGSMTPNMDPTLPSPMTASAPNTPHTLPISTNASGSSGVGSSSAGPPMQVRKTSHKAAEQKRRDSLKTTFDDLRKLLPPIALPSDADTGDASSMLTSPLFNPTTPLLPGALPPRGPPKAGGEGPNKGVSKLQLLICGNEYIRLLKARVERRDDEIGRLRREVGRLRMVVEEGGGVSGSGLDAGEGEDALDLEKDIDAVEKSAMGAHAKSGGTNEGAGDDVMDEGDDEGDD
ncbi:hypothetical protein CVT25_007568 [Psilocybe cyanescens]|uniref:BHLH domain-containing protein n=1 Tax=Psilocybe cyanescens TaxID=93625 RepID=A0A409XIM3_PSICY|nr:hypothetical protein CVT25_007568 [Psilocybe cyanescens]